MAHRLRISELAAPLVMLAALGWVCGWAYVGAAAHEPDRTIDSPSCPSTDACWKHCFRASVTALESCINHADWVCISKDYDACEVDLRATEDLNRELQEDQDDHCQARLDELIHEMFWEDRSFDEWEDSATEGGTTDADTTRTVP